MTRPAGENDLWLRHDDAVVTTDRWTDPSCFLPVYRCGDDYSYHPLPLIRRHGGLDWNAAAADAVDARKFRYPHDDRTLDRRVTRIGGPLSCEAKPYGCDEAIDRLAEAMIGHRRRVTAANPDAEHVVLTGGADSLNLLLIDGGRNTIAASAEPNFPLVQQFVRRNGLDIDVVRLDDDADEEQMRHEIRCTFGLVRYDDIRWGTSMRRIADASRRPVVFWQGSMGGTLLGGRSARYCRSVYRYRTFSERYLRSSRPRLWRGSGRRDLARRQRLSDALWLRGAHWQGGSHAVLRAICGALVASGYHGPDTYDVLARLPLVPTGSDWRPALGRRLAGGEVWYPDANPFPPQSARRIGRQSSEILRRLLMGSGGDEQIRVAKTHAA